MTNKEILQADMLDILFEHRNKLYGAYALRKTYDRRLAIALGAALLTVLMSLAFSFFKNDNNNKGSNRNGPGLILKPFEIPKDEIKEEVKPKEKPPQKSTADFNKIVVVPNDKADKDIPDMEKISTSVIGDENLDGDLDDGTGKQTSDDNGTEETVTKEPEVKQPDLPSYPPEFPGGSAAWLAFLQRYLQAPEDLEPGQKIEVLVQFWVDVDGGISKTEVIKSGGSSFDKEVLRVLKKMPKWKPAMQHGNLVAVAYKQPVTFMGVEQ
jgi:periplasmic protein TonB